MNRRHFLTSTAALAGVALPVAGRTQSTLPCPLPVVNVLGGTSVGTLCAPAPPVDIPRYMWSMSDFEVRDLNRSYAPSASDVSMYSVLPAEWQVTSQPDGADNVFRAWSGGAGDSIGRRLLVHGGGHWDSSNNGLYVFDFSGDEAPKGWSIASNSLSERSAVTLCNDTYADGRPPSIHTYDQLYYDPNFRRFYRFGGSPYCQNGAGIGRCFYYDFQSESWVVWISSPNVMGDLGATLIGSPDGSKLFYFSATKSPIFVDVRSGALTPVGHTPFGTQQAGPCSAYDSRRGRWVVFFSQSGSAAEALVVTVNWSGNTWSHSRAVLTGADSADLNAEGPCVLYDTARDSFWFFASRQSGSAFASIYEVDAASFAVSRHALSMPIQTYASPKGGYNRHVWFEDWRVIGTVHRHDSPVSIIKLPEA